MYFIAVFDTNAAAFLPESIPLPGCMNAIVSPSNSNKQQLSVMCTSTNDVRFFDISETGNGRVAARLPLRLRGRTNRFGLSIGFTSLLSTENGDKAILDDGSFFEIDNRSKKISRLGIIDGKSRKGGFDKSPALTGDSEGLMASGYLSGPLRSLVIRAHSTWESHKWRISAGATGRLPRLAYSILLRSVD